MKFHNCHNANDRCYYFYDKEVQSFNEAQRICDEKLKEFGFSTGILYEPRNQTNFIRVYELAEKFAWIPSVQIWLGLRDRRNNGQFQYVSDGGFPLIKQEWGGNVFLDLYHYFNLYICLPFLMFVQPAGNTHTYISYHVKEFQMPYAQYRFIRNSVP